MQTTRTGARCGHGDVVRDHLTVAPRDYTDVTVAAGASAAHTDSIELVFDATVRNVVRTDDGPARAARGLAPRVRALKTCPCGPCTVTPRRLSRRRARHTVSISLHTSCVEAGDVSPPGLSTLGVRASITPAEPVNPTRAPMPKGKNSVTSHSERAPLLLTN